MFDDLQQFRFADGDKFSWDGQKWQSGCRRGGTLAGSNARARKGFVPTFAVGRNLFGVAGKYRLDWFLVKSRNGSVADREEFQFEPFYARTYPEINMAMGKRISDHAPSTLDLPLIEPELASSTKQRKP